MNAFQFFCALILGTLALLYALKYVYNTYFAVCPRCEAERMTPIADDVDDVDEEEEEDDDIEW